MTPISKPLDIAASRPRLSRRYPISSSVVSGLLAAADSLVLLVTGALFYAATFGIPSGQVDIYGGIICFVWIVSLLLFQFCDLYKLDAILHPISYLDRLVVSALTAILFLLAAALAFKATPSVSYVWVGAFGLSAFSLVFLVRIGLSRAVLHLAGERVFTRNVVISGSEEYVTRLLHRMSRQPADFLSVVGVFVDRRTQSSICGVPVLGTPADVDAFVRSEHVDDVVLALPWSEDQRIFKTVEGLRELPVNVYLGSDLVGLALDFSPPPDHFSRLPVVAVVGQPLSGWAVVIKTIEDYVLATFCLLLALPVMGLIALLIRIDSPGPILFRQKRLGFNNREFYIYKFRSMRHVPVQVGPTIQATPGDRRVTAVGRFLRRSSLDELPQLFNVINGTMSLVGPRPHAIDHNEEYSRKIRGYFARHRVKPGLTGWAQVKGFRGVTDTPEKMAARVRHDIYYTENWSLFFDIQILARTFFAMLNGNNAH